MPAQIGRGRFSTSASAEATGPKARLGIYSRTCSSVCRVVAKVPRTRLDHAWRGTHRCRQVDIMWLQLPRLLADSPLRQVEEVAIPGCIR